MCGKRCVVTGKDTENLSANAAVMFCTRCSLIRKIMGGPPIGRAREFRFTPYLVDVVRRKGEMGRGWKLRETAGGVRSFFLMPGRFGEHGTMVQIRKNHIHFLTSLGVSV